jgi:hypothetical protein
MLTSHHTWSEEMFRVAFERATAGRPLHPSLSRVDELFPLDGACVEAWNRLPSDGPSLLQMIDGIVAAGNVEAGGLYARSEFDLEQIAASRSEDRV